MTVFHIVIKNKKSQCTQVIRFQRMTKQSQSLVWIDQNHVVRISDTNSHIFNILQTSLRRDRQGQCKILARQVEAHLIWHRNARGSQDAEQLRVGLPDHGTTYGQNPSTYSNMPTACIRNATESSQ